MFNLYPLEPNNYITSFFFLFLFQFQANRYGLSLFRRNRDPAKTALNG